jgi:hypothetical protein
MHSRFGRRRFLRTGAAVAALTSLPTLLRAERGGASGAPGTLSITPGVSFLSTPATFMGLSYESSQLSHPGYFSTENRELVTLVRSLGTQGVLRIGGNTSDYDDWTSEKVDRTDPAWAGVAGPDTGLDINHHTRVTTTAIDELRTFLDATGWKLMYGIDLGHGSPQSAADEAEYVVRTIGPALMALQIGNEPDLFYRNGIRKPDYSYADYFAEWKKFADAIRKRTPDAPLAGPDVGNHYDWFDQFAAQATGIKLLTSHYYAEGPPTSPAADIPHLLNEHPTLVEHAEHVVKIGRKHGVPYRMAEANSCYHGGKEDVSDAFASALWGADFMMLLAQLGVVGVNFHGGGQGFYTPIAGGSPSAPLNARPLFYGMLLFREFLGKAIAPCSLNAGSVNATAYVSLDADGRKKLAIINKDLSAELAVKLDAKDFAKPTRQLHLTSPSAESKTGILLGGKTVSAREVFSASWSGPSAYKAGVVTVPKTSALLLEFA